LQLVGLNKAKLWRDGLISFGFLSAQRNVKRAAPNFGA
jgi:hypothetical protein